MTIALRGTIQSAQNTGTLPAVNKPAGVVAGDYIELWVSQDDGGPVNYTFPSGFTAFNGGTAIFSSVDAQSLLGAWKIAGSSEPSTYTVVSTDTVAFGMVLCVAYQNVDNVTPQDGVTPVNGSMLTPTASPAAGPNLSLTTASANDNVHMCCTNDLTTNNATQSWSPPAGFTSQATVVHASGWFSMDFSDTIQAVAGSTGSIHNTSTFAGGGNTGILAFMVALRPAASTAIVTDDDPPVMFGPQQEIPVVSVWG